MPNRRTHTLYTSLSAFVYLFSSSFFEHNFYTNFITFQFLLGPCQPPKVAARRQDSREGSFGGVFWGILNATLKPTIRRYVCANENKFPFGTSFYATATSHSLFYSATLPHDHPLTRMSFFVFLGYSAAIAPTPPTTTTTTISPSNLLPYFDFDVPRNLTVTVGQTGFLHCRVERLGDKDVSRKFTAPTPTRTRFESGLERSSSITKNAMPFRKWRPFPQTLSDLKSKTVSERRYYLNH